MIAGGIVNRSDTADDVPVPFTGMISGLGPEGVGHALLVVPGHSLAEGTATVSGSIWS